MAQAGKAPAGPARPDYDGRRFRPPGSGGQPGGALGCYHQLGDLVWAEFSGGGVRAGRLAGTCRPDGIIDAAYCLVTSDGQVAAGECVSTPTVLADGRIRLTERWRRLDGSTGESQIEETIE